MLRCSARGSALAVVAVALAGLVVPSVAPAAPTEDSVAGTATTLGTDVPGSPVVDWAFSVTSGPSGENPSGTVRAAQPPSDTTFFAGPVTCLNVHGTVALLTVQTPQFGPVSVRVTDNAGTGAPDLIESTPSSPSATCTVPEAAYIRHDAVTSGDIVVIDAPTTSLPTDKDQCRHGGYAAFGFRNQGQCVAFGQRGPKP